ncbi:MAG TPA: sigma-70 family RNA polymerase sigma factor [Acidobacteriaceae bacterium]|nr:sigma-70 family RNA polymerase sigma factor [Acidobacteriaceae bacterium]
MTIHPNGDPSEHPLLPPDENFSADSALNPTDFPVKEEENPENSDLEAQLAALDGVSEDMGTLALDRTQFRETQPSLPLPPSLRAGDWTQATDAEIMQRAGLGDEACLEYLISKYRRPIVYFMFRMVRNQAVAEELAQEVFLRVYRSRQSYRAEARFSTWLYRIATNLAVNYARDTKQERSASTVYLDATDAETVTSPDVADSHLSVEQNLLQQERMRQIRAHVMALPERQRMAVLMHKYQELNYKEIGDVLKLSESATKSLLFRAYQTLRENLKEFA